MTPVSDHTENAVQPRTSWASLIWFGGLLIAVYGPILWALIKVWDRDADMGHGFFVPLIAGFIAWQKRHDLLAEPPSPNWWGLAVVIYSGLQLYIATLGAEVFLGRTA